MSKQNFVQVIDGSERCLNGHPIVQAVWDGTPWLCADGTCEYSIKNVEPKPPNTTPLNEEDRLGEQLLLKKILLIDTVNNILGEVDGVPDRNAFVLLGTPAELIRQMSELIQTLEKKARKEERSLAMMYLHDTNRQDDYKRKIAQLEKGSE
jgi:hypothetical protein